MTAPTDRAFLNHLLAGVVGYTALASLGGWYFRSGGFALGVAAGGAVVLLNLLAAAGLVRRILREPKARFLVAYGLKTLALFAAVATLLYGRWVEGLPFLLGLLSLFAATLAAAAYYLIGYRKSPEGPRASG